MVLKTFAGYILARYITHSAVQRTLDYKASEQNVVKYNGLVKSMGSNRKGFEHKKSECKHPEHNNPKCKRHVHKRHQYKKPAEHTKIHHNGSERKGPDHKGLERRRPVHKEHEHKGPKCTKIHHKRSEHKGPDHKGLERKRPVHKQPEHKQPEHKGPKRRWPMHKWSKVKKTKRKGLELNGPNHKLEHKEPESKQPEYKGTTHKGIKSNVCMHKWQGQKKLVHNGLKRRRLNRKGLKRRRRNCKGAEHKQPQHMRPEHEYTQHNVPKHQVSVTREPETWAELWQYAACQCRRTLAAYAREIPPNTDTLHGGKWIPIWEYMYNPREPSFVRYRLKEELDPLLWHYSCHPTFTGYIPVRRLYYHPVHGKILGEPIMTPKWDYTCYPIEKRASLVPATPLPDEEAGIIVPCTLQSCPDKIVGQDEAANLQRYPERKIVSIELPAPLNNDPKTPPLRVERNSPKKPILSVQPLTTITRRKFNQPQNKYCPPCQGSPLPTQMRKKFWHESDYIMARRSALSNVTRTNSPFQEINAGNSMTLNSTLNQGVALTMEPEKPKPSVKPLTAMTRKNFYLPPEKRFPPCQGSPLPTLTRKKF